MKGQPSSVSKNMKRPYKAIIWVGEKPGQHVEVIASTLGEASSMIKEKYGKETVVSLWSEDDANRPRQTE